MAESLGQEYEDESEKENLSAKSAKCKKTDENEEIINISKSTKKSTKKKRMHKKVVSTLYCIASFPLYQVVLLPSGALCHFQNLIQIKVFQEHQYLSVNKTHPIRQHQQHNFSCIIPVLPKQLQKAILFNLQFQLQQPQSILQFLLQQCYQHHNHV